MPNIKITDIDVPATSQRLQHEPTKGWWAVMRPILEAKAVRHLIETARKAYHERKAAA